MAARGMILVIAFLAMMSASAESYAQPWWGRGGGGPDSYEGMPYGRYCPGHRWGPYGARRVVKTADEAKEAMEKYFSGSGKTVQVGKVEERRRYFEAEITDSEGKPIDRLIIDKRSGRIRSIY